MRTPIPMGSRYRCLRWRRSQAGLPVWEGCRRCGQVAAFPGQPAGSGWRLQGQAEDGLQRARCASRSRPARTLARKTSIDAFAREAANRSATGLGRSRGEATYGTATRGAPASNETGCRKAPAEDPGQQHESPGRCRGAWAFSKPTARRWLLCAKAVRIPERLSARPRYAAKHRRKVSLWRANPC